ncbi:Uncharacterised protein [Legionella gratiana]|uniref:Uncharacterized protein n=1 Tax=Legionella gratiana TaxID=45066 RepID=A0A378JET6_9GAMM|nr:Uncharacterised protein [Legionella gratiana]
MIYYIRTRISKRGDRYLKKTADPWLEPNLSKINLSARLATYALQLKTVT